MHIREYIPVNTLRPFIRSFMIIESEYEVRNDVLPDTSLVMAFRVKGAVTASDDGILAPAVMGGLRKTARSLVYAGNTANLLVVFRSAGAAAFFRTPMHELFGASVSLDNFIGRQELADISEQLMEAPDQATQIERMEQFLLKLWRQSQPDLLVQTAIQRITQTHGHLRIKELLDGLYISQDALEKRFRKVTGASPKQFSSIVRLRTLITKANDTTLTELAYNAGYFDQAHFIKDFKAFTGKAPREFYKSALFW